MLRFLLAAFLALEALGSFSVSAVQTESVSPLRNLQSRTDSTAFIAEYHNKVVAAVMDDPDSHSSLPSILEAMASFLEKDEGFPSFSKDEMIAHIEEVLPPEELFDFDAVVQRLLEEHANESPVMKALLGVKHSLDEVESVDAMVDTVNAAAAGGNEQELEKAAIFEAVAYASASFWTEYFDSGDGGRKLRFKWLKILFVDAFGALMGSGLGPVGSVWMGSMFSIVAKIIAEN